MKRFIYTYCYLLFLLGLPNLLFSQAEIKGKLNRCDNCTVMAIKDNSDLRPSKVFVPSKPDAYNNFVFEFKDVYRPTVTIVEVEYQSIPVFLLPDTQVWLTINGGGNELSYTYTKQLAEENRHLLNYYKKYGWITQRDQSTIWYENTGITIPDNIHKQYSAVPDSLKLNYALQLREQMLLDASKDAQSLYDNYNSFINKYSNYASLAVLLNLLNNEENSPETLTAINEVLNDFSFNEADRNNPAFIPALKSVVEFLTVQNDAPERNFNEHFTYIAEHFDFLPKKLKEDYLIYIMEEHLSPATVQGLEPILKPFIQSLSSLDKMLAVLEKYEEAKQGADGMKAPAFTLVNKNGKPVSLADFKGKNVYLAFWSSTCRPCMEGMVKSRPNKTLLSEEDIAFVYISTDRTKSTWLGNKYVRGAGNKDVHLWSGLSAVDIKEYNAISLPTYYFIDKKGNFVSNFPHSWESDFVNFVKNQD